MTLELTHAHPHPVQVEGSYRASRSRPPGGSKCRRLVGNLNFSSDRRGCRNSVAILRASHVRAVSLFYVSISTPLTRSGCRFLNDRFCAQQHMDSCTECRVSKCEVSILFVEQGQLLNRVDFKVLLVELAALRSSTHFS